MPRSRRFARVRLLLEPLEARLLFDGGPVTIAGDPRYVGAIPAGGGAIVHVYDADATPDVTLADVAVKPGTGNAISGITLVGAQRKTGLGILITGASSAGKVGDKRSLPADVAFIASTAPLASLSLRSSIAGHNLNGLTLGGLPFAQDLDGDGDLNDPTALWVQGSVAKLSLAGDVGVWAGPPRPAGDGAPADVIIAGGLGKLAAAAYDTVHGDLFGITAEQFGKLTLGRTALTTANLPFAHGQFRIVLAQDAMHKGVALPLWDENVNLAQLRATLDNLLALGANWVEANVFWFQDDISSSVIAPDFTRWSASDASVRTVIDEVHARGMRVLLKPMVDLRNDPAHWRGDIPGSDPWFTGPQGYGAFLNHFADIAQQEGADMLCVGTELVSTSPQEAQWRALIAGVRARYTGPLVYAANHGGTGSATQEKIAWWDALDYIGLDAYYPLTAKPDPTLAELQAAWAARGATIENWLAALDPADRKPVLFTEVGYRSWDGANVDPASQADRGDAGVDLQEQADSYQALFTTLWRQETWLVGTYWWNWEVDPNPVWEAPNWYTPQGKPAEGILRLYYS
ncbi:MAG: hypothetical protein FJ291_18755 [Planctomycetes bacterium]|nr:hypothetical protein [Planctomycetota bacterium]